MDARSGSGWTRCGRDRSLASGWARCKESDKQDAKTKLEIHVSKPHRLAWRRFAAGLDGGRSGRQLLQVSDFPEYILHVRQHFCDAGLADIRHGARDAGGSGDCQLHLFSLESPLCDSHDDGRSGRGGLADAAFQDWLCGGRCDLLAVPWHAAGLRFIPSGHAFTAGQYADQHVQAVGEWHFQHPGGATDIHWIGTALRFHEDFISRIGLQLADLLRAVSGAAAVCREQPPGFQAVRPEFTRRAAAKPQRAGLPAECMGCGEQARDWASGRDGRIQQPGANAAVSGSRAEIRHRSAAAWAVQPRRGSHRLLSGAGRIRSQQRGQELCRPALPAGIETEAPTAAVGNHARAYWRGKTDCHGAGTHSFARTIQRLCVRHSDAGDHSGFAEFPVPAFFAALYPDR